MICDKYWGHNHDLFLLNTSKYTARVEFLTLPILLDLPQHRLSKKGLLSSCGPGREGPQAGGWGWCKNVWSLTLSLEYHFRNNPLNCVYNTTNFRTLFLHYSFAVGEGEVIIRKSDCKSWSPVNTCLRIIKFSSSSTVSLSNTGITLLKEGETNGTMKSIHV